MEGGISQRFNFKMARGKEQGRKPKQKKRINNEAEDSSEKSDNPAEDTVADEQMEDSESESNQSANEMQVILFIRLKIIQLKIS